MLIEVKAKVARFTESKPIKRTETFIVEDCELFSQAEYRVLSTLIHQQEEGTVESFEILSLRQSPIKEVYGPFQGEHPFLATLRDIWLADDGTEKSLRYKILLWGSNLTEANADIHRLAHQGYDMQIEGLKQVDYEYLGAEFQAESSQEEDSNE